MSLDGEEALGRLDDTRLPLGARSFRDDVQGLLLSRPESDGTRSRGLGRSSNLAWDRTRRAGLHCSLGGRASDRLAAGLCPLIISDHDLLEV